MCIEEKSSYNKKGTFNSECLPKFSNDIYPILNGQMSIFMAIIIKTIAIKMNNIRLKS